MESILITNHKEGIEKLVKLAIDRSLVPIFGAGFTAGCQACNGIVPNSSRAIEGMCKLIMQSDNCPFERAEIGEKDFFDVAEIFFKLVSEEKRASYFEEYYTGVQLFQDQIAFLSKIKWTHAYTINVDDGIEKNSDFNAILPYHHISRPKTSKKLLYKLHGDASHESQYLGKNQENIVFSRIQYLQAITSPENRDIYNALISDYAQKNLLFIGCSLNDEQDLEFVYKKSEDYQTHTCRAILREKKPSAYEQYKLREHGINEIVIVESYEGFYKEFVEAYQKIEDENREKIYKHINPKIELQQDRRESIQLISGKTIFDPARNVFNKGMLHVFRHVIYLIQKELEINHAVLLRGRRFSGKTYILSSLVEYYKNRDVLYFPSDTFIDEDVVEQILSEQKNSVLLFDSNSITQEVYYLLIEKYAEFEKRDNYLVVAINSNDVYLLTKLRCNILDVQNTFSADEIAASNKGQDSFGLARRRGKETNIDYLYTLKESQNIDIPFAKIRPSALSLKEKSALISLSALDKIYYTDLMALGIGKQEIDRMCQRLSPLIELIPTSKEEGTRHSSEKLVHNSKVALVALVNQFSVEEIAKAVLLIVQKYRYKRLYIDVILFDTLNQIFSRYNNTEKLIYTIYKKLQPVLDNDPHYWLQRAKSIYRLTDDIEQLEEAYTYAKKTYIDAYNKGLSAKAALTIALILCAIAEQKGEKEKLQDYKECVVLANEAVFSSYYHSYPAYLTSALPIGENKKSEKRLTDACTYVKKHCDPSESECKISEKILQYFNSVRQNYVSK